jgi:hypothetical protein
MRKGWTGKLADAQADSCAGASRPLRLGQTERDEERDEETAARSDANDEASLRRLQEQAWEQAAPSTAGELETLELGSRRWWEIVNTLIGNPKK